MFEFEFIDQLKAIIWWWWKKQSLNDKTHTCNIVKTQSRKMLHERKINEKKQWETNQW